MGFGGYHLSDLDRQKSSGERRFEALSLLSEHSRSPEELALMWDVTPTSAYRVLERLRKYHCVDRDRDSSVMGCPYSITERGLGRLAWFLGQATLGNSDRLPQGPVSLMRLLEVEEMEKITDKYPPSELTVEKKYDGWLVQAIDGELYTRRGKLIGQNFIPISRALQKYSKARLIGELVYWNAKTGKMDESSVTRVAGTKDPVEAAAKMAKLETEGLFQIILFDILEKNGKDLTGEPFEKRYKILRDTVRAGKRLTLPKVYPFSRWEDAYQDALAEGGEGVVLKNKQAAYLWAPLGDSEPLKQGYQWKLKEVQSDDFVIYDSYRTEKGSLIVVFGQYDGRDLVNVGEMNNFSQEREKEILKKLKKGKFLMEIAFQERFPKPPGKLRNPRFLRFREDLPVTSAKLPRKFR
jgi:ATP-dependent DNA ligase